MTTEKFTDEELNWLHIACTTTRDLAFQTMGNKDHEIVKKWDRLRDKVTTIRVAQKEGANA